MLPHLFKWLALVREFKRKPNQFYDGFWDEYLMEARDCFESALEIQLFHLEFGFGWIRNDS